MEVLDLLSISLLITMSSGRLCAPMHALTAVLEPPAKKARVEAPSTSAVTEGTASATAVYRKGNTVVIRDTCAMLESAVRNQKADEQLREDDLVDVVGYLHTLDKSQLSHLGTVLGLSRHHVKGMKDSDSFLEDIISLWLQQAGNVKTRSGVPTWRRLVEALRHKLLGQNGIASQIAIQINFKIILQS